MALLYLFIRLIFFIGFWNEKKKTTTDGLLLGRDHLPYASDDFIINFPTLWAVIIPPRHFIFNQLSFSSDHTATAHII